MEKNHTTGFTELHLNIANGAHITPEIPYVSNKLYHSVLINIYLIIFLALPTSVPASHLFTFSLWLCWKESYKVEIAHLPNPRFRKLQYPVLFPLLLQWQKCFFYKNQAPHIGVPLAFLTVSIPFTVPLASFSDYYQFSSVQFSHSVMSDPLWPHEPQHTRPLCPSPTPGVHPNPCPLCWWCHPAISSSVVPFSSCPQSFPASESFHMSQLSTSGGQSIGVSASASVLPMNTQDWSPLGWTGWIWLQSKGLSRVFSNTTVQKHQFFSNQLYL